MKAPPELSPKFDHWRNKPLDKMLSESDIGFVIDLESSSGVSIATSGDYYHIKKYGYHHIMRAGDMSAMKASVSSVAAVSVLEKTCALADGIVTAAMTFDSLKSCEYFVKGIMNKVPDKVFEFRINGRGEHKLTFFTKELVPTENIRISDSETREIS